MYHLLIETKSYYIIVLQDAQYDVPLYKHVIKDYFKYSFNSYFYFFY